MFSRTQRAVFHGAWVVGLVAAPCTWALGVGQIRVHSALNHLFNADVPLVAGNPAETTTLIARVPRQQEFDEAGIERASFISSLRFKVQDGPSGPVLHISSLEPIREPNFQMLVELVWPRGRMLRSFQIQLDPEQYAHRRQPITTVETVTMAPTQEGASTRKAAPIPALPEPPQVSFEGASARKVTSGETLASIAKRTPRGKNISTPQMMAILLAGNPEAFTDKNPNTLRSGATLKVPTPQALGADVPAVTPAPASGTVATASPAESSRLAAATPASPATNTLQAPPVEPVKTPDLPTSTPPTPATRSAPPVAPVPVPAAPVPVPTPPTQGVSPTGQPQEILPQPPVLQPALTPPAPPVPPPTAAVPKPPAPIPAAPTPPAADQKPVATAPKPIPAPPPPVTPKPPVPKAPPPPPPPVVEEASWFTDPLVLGGLLLALLGGAGAVAWPKLRHRFLKQRAGADEEENTVKNEADARNALAAISEHVDAGARAGKPASAKSTAVAPPTSASTVAAPMMPTPDLAAAYQPTRAVPNKKAARSAGDPATRTVLTATAEAPFPTTPTPEAPKAGLIRLPGADPKTNLPPLPDFFTSELSERPSMRNISSPHMMSPEARATPSSSFKVQDLPSELNLGDFNFDLSDLAADKSVRPGAEKTPAPATQGSLPFSFEKASEPVQKAPPSVSEKEEVPPLAFTLAPEKEAAQAPVLEKNNDLSDPEPFSLPDMASKPVPEPLSVITDPFDDLPPMEVLSPEPVQKPALAPLPIDDLPSMRVDALPPILQPTPKPVVEKKADTVGKATVKEEEPPLQAQAFAFSTVEEASPEPLTFNSTLSLEPLATPSPAPKDKPAANIEEDDIHSQMTLGDLGIHAAIESPSDPIGTRLDFVKIYIEMGDHVGARSLLEDILREGNAEQKAKAEDMLKQLD